MEDNLLHIKNKYSITMLCPEKHQFYFLKNLTYLFLKTVSEKAYIIHLQHEIAARAG